ncbi:hypothetical protein HDV00_010789 [Rhizophlyctis rosea]|nr:hypothetical protein HDV00_010789 [Rhizophlyctis rosea]
MQRLSVRCSLFSETIEQDKTYAPLAKYDNVFVHDIKKHPIDNELLEAVWERQKQRYKEDRKNDLLIVFDDLGNKMKGREMRAMMNKFAQLGRHPDKQQDMLVKSFDQLNEILEDFSKNQEWVNVNSEIKQKLLNEIHEELAEGLLYNQVKKSTKPKASRRVKKVEHDDGNKTE